jgi:hypothetical protein
MELNDDSIVPKLKERYENLNDGSNKVYAHNTNEAWLYEQPQTIEPFLAKHVNSPETTTPFQTPTMKPRTLIKHIVPLCNPSFIPTTPTSINKA